MAESLEELALPEGADQLLMPPRNPMAPPDAIGEAISMFVNPPYAEVNRQRRGQASDELQARMSHGVQHTLNWMKFPAQTMETIKPEVEGKWSEEDEFRQRQKLGRQVEWGPQTALGIVFDPVPALAARLAAPAGSYALRNMRMTPVEGNPFVDAAPEVALGVFAGPTAKTANMAKLKKAEALEKTGQSEEQIWKETGWFRGADKKWRFEIDDRNAKFNPGEHKQVRPMGEVLEHRELYKAYPNLKNINTETFSASGEGFHWGTNPAAPKREKIRVPTGNTIYDEPFLSSPGAENISSSRNVALHEIQHAIQDREGFATGGNPRELLPLVEKEFDKITDPHVYQEMMDKKKEVAHEAYKRLAGEVEARNVSRRSGGSDKYPRMTEDRPREKQTVRGVSEWKWPNKSVSHLDTWDKKMGVKLTSVDHNPFVNALPPPAANRNQGFKEGENVVLDKLGVREFPRATPGEAWEIGWKTPHQKTFKWSDYGGEHEAHAAAQNYLKQLTAQYLPHDPFK